MHLNNLEQQDWIRQRFEAPRVTELSHDQKKVRYSMNVALQTSLGAFQASYSVYKIRRVLG